MKTIIEPVKRLRLKAGMRLAEEGRKICFCHVPKCGGISIGRSLSSQMYSFWERAALPAFIIDIGASDRSARALKKSKTDLKEEVLGYVLSKADHRIALGHVACRPALVDEWRKEWQFVTVLRDPVHRWISEYVYNSLKSSARGKNRLSIEEYMDSEKGKAMGVTYLRYFSNMGVAGSIDLMGYVEEAVENLSRFAVVGILEDMDRFSRDIEHKFGRRIRVGVSNASPSSVMKKELMDNDVLLERIMHLCKADSLVYGLVREKIHGGF